MRGPNLHVVWTWQLQNINMEMNKLPSCTTFSVCNKYSNSLNFSLKFFCAGSHTRPQPSNEVLQGASHLVGEFGASGDAVGLQLGCGSRGPIHPSLWRGGHLRRPMKNKFLSMGFSFSRKELTKNLAFTVVDAHVISLSWPGCSHYPRGWCNFTPRPTTYACTSFGTSPTAEDRNPMMKTQAGCVVMNHRV